MKKALFVSYHYPPDLEIGAQRVRQFVRYLPDRAVIPYVVTVLEKYHPHLDWQMQAETGMAGQVIRTRKLPWFRDIYLAIRTLIRGKKRADDLSGETAEDGENRGKEAWRAMLKRFVLSVFFWLPDDKVGWVVPGVIATIRLIRKEEIGTLITTGPPHSAHLIGLLVQCLTGVRWLVDLRDPWVNTQKDRSIRSSFSDRVETWLEQKVVTSCDVLICVTQEMTAMYRDRYGASGKCHFVTIYNGFDPNELERVAKLDKNRRFTITYTGSLYLGRDPAMFLQAIANLCRRGEVPRSDIRIRFIGDCRYFGGHSVEELAASLSLDGIVEFVDPIPRIEALSEGARAHVLLLFAQGQPLQVPGKLFDYLGMGAHILGICEDGASQTVLSIYPRAVVVDGKNPEQMEDAILRLYNMVRGEKREEGDFEYDVSQFDRRRLARRLETYI